MSGRSGPAIDESPLEHGSMMDRFQSEPSGLTERMLAGQGAYLPGQSHVEPKQSMDSRRLPDSMAMTGASHTRSTLLSSENSRNVPSLTSDSSSHPSSPTETDSARTPDLAGSNEYLLQDENGVLVVPQTRSTLECPFYFVDCRFTCTRFDEWLSHSLGHFGDNPPPNKAICPFCDVTFDVPKDPWRCWEARMRHVADHHRLGCNLSTARPDFHLYRYLCRMELITEQVLADLGAAYQPVDPSLAGRTEATDTRGYIVRESRDEQRHRRRALARRQGSSRSQDQHNI